MLIADNADKLYVDALTRIKLNGEMTNPRGFNCLELSPCHLRLTKPWKNIVSNPHRKINKGFAAAEFIWMWEGRDDVQFLDFYNSKIKQFSDDGIKFFGAYGPKLVAQLPYINRILREDPWTRQAVINIWRESPPKTKDVPCTIMLHFMQRPIGTLNLIVYMRSQDCWLGLPYDIHNFTCIQLLLANELGISVGNFDLIQGSLHAYEQDFEKINNLCSLPIPDAIESTPKTKYDLFAQKNGWMDNYAYNKVCL
jgi:thymidylate synthase